MIDFVSDLKLLNNNSYIRKEKYLIGNHKLSING